MKILHDEALSTLLEDCSIFLGEGQAICGLEFAEETSISAFLVFSGVS